MKGILIFGIAFLFLGCGDKNTEPSPSTLEQIKVEVARITEHVDHSLYAYSGDSTIFNGLLSSTFPWACEYLKASQFEDGSFARSPAHKERDDRDFSRDGAIGVLWGNKTGCLNSTQTVRWVEFVNAHDSCLSLSCDSKAKANPAFKALMQKVTGHKVDGALPIGGSWIPTVQSFFNEGSELFLDRVSIHLYGGTAGGDDGGNPLYAYIAGDKQRAAELLLQLMREVQGPAPCYKDECFYLRWQLQWQDGNDYRPEELVFVAGLLGDK